MEVSVAVCGVLLQIVPAQMERQFTRWSVEMTVSVYDYLNGIHYAHIIQ